jgi:1-acyl-sn-glycerol-3-phosphate acyltransferase
VRSLSREFRALLRLCFVITLVLGGICVVCLLFPWMQPNLRRTLKQSWSRLLIFTLGVRIRVTGKAPTHALLVSNHISWLDVFVLNALNPTTFVCKDDVKDWPLIGMLVSHSGTLFIERGSRSAAARASQAITERLNQGERVAVFPEGTTTQGTTLLPFRAAMFQAAIDAQVPVLPIHLRYLDANQTLCLAPAYDGDITFAQSMLAIVRTRRIIARVDFLALLPSNLERRDLAVRAEITIANAMGLAAPSNPSLPLSCHASGRPTIINTD